MKPLPITVDLWKYTLDKIGLVSDFLSYFLLEKKNDHFTVHYTSDAATEEFGRLKTAERNAEEYFSPSNWQVFLQVLTEQRKMTVQYRDLYTGMMKTGVAAFENCDDIGKLYLLVIYPDNDIGMSALSKHNLDPIIGISIEGDILYSNRASVGSLGFKQEKFVEMKIEDIILSINDESVQDVIEDVRNQRKTIEFANATILDVSKKKHKILIRLIPVIVHGEIVEIQCVWRMIKSAYAKENKFYKLHYLDQLTGIWNKQAMEDHFHINRQIATEKKEDLAIILFNVNHFKKINERFGSSVGDEVLINVTQRLKNLENDTCTLYRYSGDEFIFIKKQASKKKLIVLAQEIKRICKEPFKMGELEIDYQYSVGISIENPEEAELEKMIHQAKQASYAALFKKKDYYFYNASITQEQKNDKLLESHLRKAIENDELYLHYQPQIDLETNKVESFEALLRWRNPYFGQVSPAHFIPIAEESGLIIILGDWALEEVCKKLKSWYDKGWTHLSIAVNISAYQFKELNFVNKLIKLIEKYKFDPKMLELEITESSLMDVEQTIDILSSLKELKMIISIDDFGTGYSSLNYIKSYPIDIIKIDQSFIKEIESDEKNRAIAKTIIHLAHSLGISVIAEGVELPEHVSILKTEKCEKAQGYLFSKPVPFEVIEQQYLLV